MLDPLYLHIQARGRGPSRVVELLGETIRVGKGAQCEIRLGDPALAEVECLLRLSNDIWHIHPLPGSAKVSIDSRPVAKTRALAPGVPVRVGDFVLTLRPSRAGVRTFGSFEAPIPVESRGAIDAVGPSVEPERLDERAVFVSQREIESPTSTTSTREGFHDASRARTALDGRENWLKTRREEKLWESRWRVAGASIRARESHANRTDAVRQQPREERVRQPVARPREIDPTIVPFPSVVSSEKSRPTDFLRHQDNDEKGEQADILDTPRLALAMKAFAVEEPAATTDRSPDTSRSLKTSPVALLAPTPDPEDLASEETELSLRLEMTPVREFETQDSRFEIRDSRSETQNSSVENRDSSVEIQDSSVKFHEADEGLQVSEIKQPGQVEELTERTVSPNLESRILNLESDSTEPLQERTVESPTPKAELSSSSRSAPLKLESRISSLGSDGLNSKRDPASGVEPYGNQTVISRNNKADSLLTAAPAIPRKVRNERGSATRFARTEKAVSAARPDFDTDEMDWPSARMILATQQPATRLIAPPVANSSRSRCTGIVPTQRREPSHVRLHFTIGLLLLLPALFLSSGGAILAWIWSQDDREAGALADRLLRPKVALEETNVEDDSGSDRSWWRTTTAHLALRATSLSRGALIPTREEQVRDLWNAAVGVSPLEPVARMARAKALELDRAPSAGLLSLGMSRDVISLAWTGRVLARAGKSDQALKAYRSALDLAVGSDLSRIGPLSFRDETKRYALPHEDLMSRVIQELAANPDWTFDRWSAALPSHGVAWLATYNLLRDRESPDADKALDRLVSMEKSDSRGANSTHLAARAEALALRQRYADAATLYREAISGTTDESIARILWWNLAEILAKSGDRTALVDALNAARAGRGDDEIGRRAGRALAEVGLSGSGTKPAKQTHRDSVERRDR